MDAIMLLSGMLDIVLEHHILFSINISTSPELACSSIGFDSC